MGQSSLSGQERWFGRRQSLAGPRTGRERPARGPNGDDVGESPSKLSQARGRAPERCQRHVSDVDSRLVCAGRDQLLHVLAQVLTLERVLPPGIDKDLHLQGLCDVKVQLHTRTWSRSLQR